MAITCFLASSPDRASWNRSRRAGSRGVAGADCIDCAAARAASARTRTTTRRAMRSLSGGGRRGTYQTRPSGSAPGSGTVMPSAGHLPGPADRKPRIARDMTEAVAVPARTQRGSVFGPILLGSYALMLLNMARDIAAVPVQGALALDWVVAAWLAWSAVFVLLVLLPIALLDRALRLGVVARVLGPWSARGRAVLLALLVLALATLQVFIFVDASVFRIFGFHFNGFVWNLITVPGGIESMGAGPWTIVGFVVVVVAALAVQAGIVVYAVRRARRCVAGGRRRWGLLAGVALGRLLGFERRTLGLSDAANQRRVLAAAGAFPLLPPVRMHSFAKSIGIEAQAQGPEHLKIDALRVRYPLTPVT